MTRYGSIVGTLKLTEIDCDERNELMVCLPSNVIDLKISGATLTLHETQSLSRV